MKRFISLLIAFSFLKCVTIYADVFAFQNGNSIQGIAIQTNKDEVLILTDTHAFWFSLKNIKEIRKQDLEKKEPKSKDRILDFRNTILLLSIQQWATHLTQIPATVIDNGIFKNVPYVSFKCGEDYEVNIYGDPLKPSAVEVGVYRKLLDNRDAKNNCLKFIKKILINKTDKETLDSLKLNEDLQKKNGLSFEITPPTAKDAYFGWWISVYSEDMLNSSRASENELEKVSISKANVIQDKGNSGWGADDIKLARSEPQMITVTNSSGEVITNAIVVRVVDEAYLIWMHEATGAMVKLKDLPESLQKRFGYNPVKAERAYANEETRKKRLAETERKRPQNWMFEDNLFNSSGYSSVYVSPSKGRVYVNGYMRKNGTYVAPYTRKASRR